MLSTGTMGSIYNNWEMAMLAVNPFHSLFLFAFTSPSVQVKEESDHSFSRRCSDVFSSSRSLENTNVGREYYLVRGACLSKSARKWLKHKCVDDRMPIAISKN